MKTWLTKIFFFTIGIILIQVIAIQLSHRGTFAEYEKLKEALKKNTTIVYFGDSTARRTASDDQDKRSIGDFLQDRLPNSSIQSIDHEAYNLEVYSAFSGVITRSSHKPTFVIIPINLRTFSPLMYEKSETRFHTEQAFLRWRIPSWFYKPFKTFYQPLGILNHGYLSENEILELNGDALGPLATFLQPPAKIPTPEEEKQRVAVNYLLPIPQNHSYLRAGYELSSQLITNNITPIYYFTPLDTERMQKSWPDIVARIDERKNLIQKALEKPGSIILDLTEKLPSDGFIQDAYASEHLNQKGRTLVAEYLTQAISTHASNTQIKK